MNKYLRTILLPIASHIGAILPLSVIEQIYAIAVIRQKLQTHYTTKQYKNREEMWKEILTPFESIPVDLVEFGVFEGYSIQWFARNNSHKDSRFYGFDSFEGLPEFWSVSHPQSMFDLSGAIPKFDDQRIMPMKGWFQNTVAKFISAYTPDKQLIVHFDADLYSSTLYILMQVDSLKKKYIGIFDEFRGDEARALYNYTQATGATVEIVARTEHTYLPAQVVAIISPCSTYEAGSGGARSISTQNGDPRT